MTIKRRSTVPAFMLFNHLLIKNPKSLSPGEFLLLDQPNHKNVSPFPQGTIFFPEEYPAA